MLSVQPGLRGINDLRVGRKWRLFNCCSVQGTDGCPTGPHPENRVGDQDIENPDRPVSSGLQVPMSRGIVVQEQDLLGELTTALFLQNAAICNK